MTQYIDKDALVAEIKRKLLIYTKRYNELAKYEVWGTAKEIDHKIEELKGILSLIDTLEVKEVDLEKEVEDYMDKYNGVWVDSDYIKFAKHFFELGLKTQKGD